MDYQSVGSAKGTAKKKKGKKASKKKVPEELGEEIPVIGVSDNDESTIKAPAKKGKKGKVAKKKLVSGNADDDFELFENEGNLEDAEMLKDLNEQDLEDLKEIRALEKIASIR